MNSDLGKTSRPGGLALWLRLGTAGFEGPLSGGTAGKRSPRPVCARVLIQTAAVV